jgi:hypothetical protein
MSYEEIIAPIIVQTHLQNALIDLGKTDLESLRRAQRRVEYARAHLYLLLGSCKGMSDAIVSTTVVEFADAT